MLLAAPPLASEDTERMPALIVVAPVYVFAPESVTVPAVVLVSPPVPPRVALIAPFWTA